MTRHADINDDEVSTLAHRTAKSAYAWTQSVQKRETRESTRLSVHLGVDSPGDDTDKKGRRNTSHFADTVFQAAVIDADQHH
eukprot:2133515-Pyramimonas_sp.AAC.1